MVNRKSRLRNASDHTKVEFENFASNPSIDPSGGQRGDNRYTLISNDVDLVLDPPVINEIDELSASITRFFHKLEHSPESFFAPGIYKNLEEDRRNRSIEYLKKIVSKRIAFLIERHFQYHDSVAKAIKWIFSKKDHVEKKPVYDIVIKDPIYIPKENIERSAEKGGVGIKGLNYKELAEYVVRLEADEPEFEAALQNARAAKAAFNEAAPPITSTPLTLPDVPPRLWKDRDPGVNAGQFLRETYAPWIEAGVMTRSAIRTCDPQLYNAYAVWLHRHPEEAVELADGTHQVGRQPSTDLVSLVERRRKTDREAKASKRAHAKMSQPEP